MDSLFFLHLEDDPLYVDLVREVLTTHGFDVETTAIDSREKFEELATEGRFDLILADYKLPDFDGLMALEIALHQCPQTPFIFLTGMMGEERAIETFKAGATDYVLKNRLSRLAPAVDRALRESRERRKLRDTQREKEELMQSILALNSQLELKVRERTSDLENAYKEMEAFSYSVSHDLRAPLRQVSGFLKLLENELGETISPATEGHLQTIYACTEKMTSLIRDLLEFSRMSTTSMVLEKVSPRQLITEIIEDMKTLEEPMQNIRVNHLPELWADSSMLKLVLENLISNALKFSAGTAEPEISIFELKSEVPETIICVEDNGVGFEMDQAHRLFQVFQRLHSPIEFDGVGIGLANVARIIRRHKGRIWAEAEPNKGARFFFSIPNSEVNH
jgi:signal transduction histidine kinase